MIFTFLYDCFLLSAATFAFPYVLWKWWRYGKYRESLFERLGFRLPPRRPSEGALCIWIHAISMGETRAAAPLYKKITEAYPQAQIFISSTTETGHAEAKRSFPHAAGYFFLPLDLSWIIKATLKRLKPDLLILMESDFWYNLVHQTRRTGTHVVLVNGKISETSSRRYAALPFFASKVFAPFDRMLVQNEEYAQRFVKIQVPAEKLYVTGNLKLSAQPKLLSPSEKNQLRQELKLEEGDRVLIIGSTHNTEEEAILKALDPFWERISNLRAILVPRHPERFEKIAEQFKAAGRPFLRYSERLQAKTAEKLILVDGMGILNSLYQIGEIAIVGGSFIPGIGGHNIFEPIAFGVPVLFGPHMEGQKDLASLVLHTGAGRQVPIGKLGQNVNDLLVDSAVYKSFQEAALKLKAQAQGSVEATWAEVKKFCTIATKRCR